MFALLDWGGVLTFEFELLFYLVLGWCVGLDISLIVLSILLHFVPPMAAAGTLYDVP
jgi:hypothetical protein